MKRIVPAYSTLTVGLPWLGLILLVILAIGYLLPIQPNDYWWYVRLGREIVETRAIPGVDTYSYTRAGQPMVYHAWLTAVLFWGLHAVGGPALTVLARGLLLAVFYIFTWKSCRLAGAGPKLAAILILIAALAGSNNWATRPQLFSFPLFSLSLFVIWQWQQGQGKYLWLLPVMVALWVNLHGAFVLCFLLVGAALVGGGGERRALLIAFGAMLLASLLNPRFFGAWNYVFTLLTDPPSQQLGAEWKPPTTEVWQGKFFFAWLLLLIPMAAFSPHRLKLTHWLWLLGFGWMALSGLRYVIWFLTVLAPLTAYLLTPLVGRYLDRPFARGIPVLDWTILLTLIALPLALLPGVRERWWSASTPVLSSTTPVEATAWLAAHPDLPGPLWSDLAFASYLIYALPERPVWIDTRFELYPLEQWEDYIDIAEAASDWQELLDQDDVALLMIDPQAQERLLTALEDSSMWTEAYRAESAVIFTRRR